MKVFTNALKVFQLLPKTNCRECGEKTCLAFAGGVFTGRIGLASCPYVSREALNQYGGEKRAVNPIEEEFNAVKKTLQTRLRSLDLRERATAIGAVFNDGFLTLPIMGKLFSIDQSSTVRTDIHVNNWVLGSVLHYITSSQGIPLSNTWVPLRELPSGRDWYPLFAQQCEGVLKGIADKYPDLFADLVELFQGKEVDEQFQSDVAVTLRPLPLVPMLLCYWKPEDGMESSLSVFFDETAEDNLGIEGIYTLGVGIAVMLERLSKTHMNEG
jgi:hypothetical protein